MHLQFRYLLRQNSVLQLHSYFVKQNYCHNQTARMSKVIYLVLTVSLSLSTTAAPVGNCSDHGQLYTKTKGFHCTSVYLKNAINKLGISIPDSQLAMFLITCHYNVLQVYTQQQAIHLYELHNIAKLRVYYYFTD